MVIIIQQGQITYPNLHVHDMTLQVNNLVSIKGSLRDPFLDLDLDHDLCLVEELAPREH